MFQPVFPEEFTDCRLITSGGQADIYRAKRDGRDHAIKVYRSTDPQLLTRGWAEVEILSRLRKKDDASGTVSTAWPRFTRDHRQDLGDGRSVLMVIYEWVEGKPIVELADDLALDLGDRLSLAIACCDALAAWHGRGLLHRDIKPDNMIGRRDSEGRFTVTLIDAGLALSTDPDGEARRESTLSAASLGTPGYRPALRLDTGAAGAARQDDLFALGATFYRLFSGRGLVVPSELPSFAEIEDPHERFLVQERSFWKRPTHPSLRDRLRESIERQRDGRSTDRSPRYSDDATLHEQQVERLLGAFGDWLGAVLLKATHERYNFLYRAPGQLKRDLKRLRDWAAERGDQQGVPPSADLSVRKASPAKKFPEAHDGPPWWHDRAAWMHEKYTEMMATHAALCQGAEALVKTDKYAVAASLISRIDPTLSSAFEVGSLRLAAQPWVRRFDGHDCWVQSASFSTDGSRIVTAGDNIVFLFDANSSEPIRTLDGHHRSALSASFSPDDARIVTSDHNGIARLFDAENGALLRTFGRPNVYPARSASFSPDGTHILVARDNIVRVFHAENGSVLLTCGPFGFDGLSASFSPDGDRIIAAGDGNGAHVIDAESGTLIRTLDGHTSHVRSAMFSPDGARVVTACKDEQVRVFDADRGLLLLTLDGHGGAVNAASFSPDGKRVVTAGEDEIIRIFDAESGTLIQRLGGHECCITSASFSPDGSHVVSTGTNSTILLYEVQDYAPRRRIQGHASALFDARAARVVTAGDEIAEDDHAARIYDAESSDLLQTLRGHGGWVKHASFSPDGTRIVTACWDKQARVFDAETGTLLRQFDGHTGYVHTASFSPDGTRVVTSCQDRLARIFDAESGQLLRTLDGHTGRVRSAMFSLDGKRIITACDDTVVRLFDAESGLLHRTLDGHRSPVLSSSYSPNGERVVTGCDGGQARVFDADSGLLLRTLDGHGGPVYAVSFSPDSTRVVTACWDRLVRVFHAETGTLLRALDRHRTPVLSASFSSDGKRVLTASEDEAFRVFDSRPVETIRRARNKTQALAPDAIIQNVGTAIPAAGAKPDAAGFAQTWVHRKRAEGHSDGDIAAAADTDDALDQQQREAIARFLQRARGEN